MHTLHSSAVNLSHSIPLPSLMASEQGQFSGYASTFTVDAAHDHIVQGAFSRTLRQWSMQKRCPNLYWEHNRDEPIGVIMTMKEDKKGLFVTGKLAMDFPMARHAYALMEKGLKGLSIGFETKKAYTQNGVRYITDLCLKEISLVHHPCNASAHIVEYKNKYMMECVTALNQLCQTMTFKK